MNLKFGGSTGNTNAYKNPEFRERMSKIRTGKKHKPHKSHVRHGFKYQHTEATREKMKLSSSTRKKIAQFDLKGNLIREFDSIKQASIFANVSRTNIRYNLNNKLIKVPKHKCLWRYLS